ncbi:uncharacterized protein TOL2_C30150 [Desulfobacula toluolica Tol2]|uniref:Uncharacterized protein n=1 Tax=Desulfobacula toluolica (strain DSM 7467 / Tol2) TaxID=651182 RepID=K0NAN9_DESTT|nr:uncharacterized protein TOL2_C30150 [Desulfobacula toluolica Tol2]
MDNCHGQDLVFFCLVCPQQSMKVTVWIFEDFTCKNIHGRFICQNKKSNSYYYSMLGGVLCKKLVIKIK